MLFYELLVRRKAGPKSQISATLAANWIPLGYLFGVGGRGGVPGRRKVARVGRFCWRAFSQGFSTPLRRWRRILWATASSADGAYWRVADVAGGVEGIWGAGRVGRWVMGVWVGGKVG